MNYFGSPFNRRTNFHCLLNTQTFEIRRFYTSFYTVLTIFNENIDDVSV